MSPHSRRPLHPALAALGALALHAGVGVGFRWMPQHASRLPAPVHVDAEMELELTDASLATSHTAPGHSPATPALSPSADSHNARRGRHGAATSPARDTAHVADPAAFDSGTHELQSSVPGSKRPRVIDLGLNDGVRRAAQLGGWFELPSGPSRPSDGGLRQGLAELDGERGASRSSAAQHAAYAAARRFAPPTGLGIFDVTADERGIVLTVTLASAPTNEAEWQRVGEELQRLLKERRLRVPPGAKGLAARLRIETGELAKHITERFRSKRGAALGQAPVHPREMRAESTRSSLEPGKLSPTLGVTIAGGGSNENIRVVLLDERPL